MKDFNLENAMELYNERTCARDYIVGYCFRDKIYYTVISGELPSELLRLTYNEDKKTGRIIPCVKCRATSWFISRMRAAYRAKYLCTLAELKAEGMENLGTAFEKYFTEHVAKKAWERNNIRFDKAPDLEMFGTNFQLKYYDATVIDMNVYVNIMKELGRD